MANRLQKGAALAGAIATLVGGFEGVSLYAYRDPVGIPTICFGETRNVTMGEHKTLPECQAMLADRIVQFSRGVDTCLRNPQAVPDPAYEAMVSLAYNIGTGAFCGSTLAKKANAGDLKGACNQFPLWNKAHGVVLPGLVRRRAEEQALCLKGAA